jgi:hypothetical protein
MPTFKVTLHIYDGLTLGHVLMTKGVDLLHIEEIPDIIEHTHKKHHDTIKLPAPEVPPRQPRQAYKHPSGKVMSQFLLEHFEHAPKQTATWKEMNKLLKDLGFGKSSVNNALSRLIKPGIVERVSVGVYKLVKKK